MFLHQKFFVYTVEKLGYVIWSGLNFKKVVVISHILLRGWGIVYFINHSTKTMVCLGILTNTLAMPLTYKFNFLE